MTQAAQLVDFYYFNIIFNRIVSPIKVILMRASWKREEKKKSLALGRIQIDAILVMRNMLYWDLYFEGFIIS